MRDDGAGVDLALQTGSVLPDKLPLLHRKPAYTFIQKWTHFHIWLAAGGRRSPVTLKMSGALEDGHKAASLWLDLHKNLNQS